MSGIFGHLNISDTDRVFNSTVGQQVIWDAASQYVNRANADLNAAMSLFVQETTSDFKRRYKLPGGGYLQQRQPDGSFGNVKAYGSWDVAFPLRDYGAAVGGNDVDMAYMTVKELDNHISTVVTQNINTVRFEILKALLNSNEKSFTDQLHGSLSVEPLANGDSVTYPPVLGASTEATDNHYLESGYANASISDSNNPFKTIASELEEHFGAPTGGGNIAVFIPAATTPYAIGLAEFVSTPEMGVRYGNDTSLAASLPEQLLPIGRILGRTKTSGVWVVEWRYLPDNYLVGVHLDTPAPLIRRIDPADTGLGDGLQLVYKEQEFPFNESFWRHRFGFGVGNRLNGVVMELGTGGSYTIPTAYQ